MKGYWVSLSLSPPSEGGGRPRRQYWHATDVSARPGVVSSATRAFLRLTTPIGGEAKVALHYLLAADIPSFVRRG